jgi:hypothetical protein
MPYCGSLAKLWPDLAQHSRYAQQVSPMASCRTYGANDAFMELPLLVLLLEYISIACLFTRLSAFAFATREASHIRDARAPRLSRPGKPTARGPGRIKGFVRVFDESVNVHRQKVESCQPAGPCWATPGSRLVLSTSRASEQAAAKAILSNNCMKR